MPVTTRRGRKLLVRDVHSRRVVRKLDVWSVFKISFVFYLCLFAVLIAAGVVLWNVAAAFGVLTTLDKSVRSLFALKAFRLQPIPALIWGSIVTALLCFLGLMANVVAAIFYNLISDLVGGLQVISISDRERERVVRDGPATGAQPVVTGSTATVPSAYGTGLGAPAPVTSVARSSTPTGTAPQTSV